MMKYDFSVIVLCYNPDLEKLKNTLKSILMQDGISYEVLIADDGSKKDYSEEVEEWFGQRGFSDFKLIKNKKNQGTVKNLLSALNKAEGKYTKNISPGDYLYDAYALKECFDCMEREQAKVCFGKAAHYSMNEGEITIYNRHSPVDLNVYRKKNRKKIQRNYFWFRDYILGACFAFEIEAAKKYTTKISDKVTYAEDTAVICMIASGEKIGFLDKWLVWYEFGTGISTTTSSKWSNILNNENKNVFQMLSKENELARKTYLYHFEGNSENRYVEVIRKIVQYPPYLIFLIKSLYESHFSKEYLQCDKKKLEVIVKNMGK